MRLNINTGLMNELDNAVRRVTGRKVKTYNLELSVRGGVLMFRPTTKEANGKTVVSVKKRKDVNRGYVSLTNAKSKLRNVKDLSPGKRYAVLKGLNNWYKVKDEDQQGIIERYFSFMKGLYWVSVSEQ